MLRQLKVVNEINICGIGSCIATVASLMETTLKSRLSEFTPAKLKGCHVRTGSAFYLRIASGRRRNIPRPRVSPRLQPALKNSWGDAPGKHIVPHSGRNCISGVALKTQLRFCDFGPTGHRQGSPGQRFGLQLTGQCVILRRGLFKMKKRQVETGMKLPSSVAVSMIGYFLINGLHLCDAATGL